MNKLHRGVVALGVSAVVAAALVAPGVQAAPGVGVSSTLSAVYWDDAQQAGGAGVNDDAEGRSLAVAPDGTVLVTGDLEGGAAISPDTAYFPVSADDSIALTSTGYDVFVAALATDDSYFAWAQRVGGDGSAATSASSVAVAADGTVLVTGNFNRAVYFPVSADDSIALTSTGSDDVFVAALNADDSYFA